MTARHVVELTEHARSDLRRIADYIFDRSALASRAEEAALAILAKADSLSTHPQRGKPLDWLGAPYRALTHRGFAVIVYRIDEPSLRVLVLRIFSRGQNWTDVEFE